MLTPQMAPIYTLDDFDVLDSTSQSYSLTIRSVPSLWHDEARSAVAETERACQRVIEDTLRGCFKRYPYEIELPGSIPYGVKYVDTMLTIEKTYVNALIEIDMKFHESMLDNH